jgi:predicted RNase H-like HicB family nuclease
MTYSVTLEHGSDGSYLAWVHELPGCFVRGASRDDVVSKLPDAIKQFLGWLRTFGEAVDDGDVTIVVAEEVDSLVEADEDSEALVRPDREPLTPADWEKVERWLSQSRQDLLRVLSTLPDEQLEWRAEGRTRTLREEVIHIAFVELMYAAWTFDLRSRAGLEEFLHWTRNVSLGRMRFLSEHDRGSLTYAEWAGAPRPEEWTARKAARRLIWHELLHLPDLRRRP